MVELKIQCDCGQKFKFDVEPASGRMPFTITCPSCGVDGTAKANALLQQMPEFQTAGASPPPIPVAIAVAAPSVAPAAAPSRLRVHISAPAAVAAPAPVQVRPAAAAPMSVRPGGRIPTISQEDRDKAEIEARAKILWGDKPDEVIRFLMLKGFANEEASEKVHMVIKERRRTIRGEGIKKIIGGSLIACGSAGTLLGMWQVGFFSPFVFGVIGVACVGGLWMLLNGLFKFLSPGSQGGDATEND